MLVLGVIIPGLRILGSFDIFDKTIMDLMEMEGEVFGSRSGVVSRGLKL
jgi:hypothetical protein